jgi:hypothetical protein
MKKIAFAIIIVITSIAGYIFAESTPKTMNSPYPSLNTSCRACERGYLKETNQGVIFEFSEKGLEPVFDAKFLKCDHCQTLSQTREFKNGYFSIPAPIQQ